MQDGKHCPKCGVDIGIWVIATAMLPNRVRCPRCKSYLAYRKCGEVLLTLVLIAVLLAGLTVYLVDAHVDLLHLGAWVAIFVISWIPVEIAAAYYLRANNTLVLVGPKSAHDA